MKRRRICVLYGSQTGTAQDVAELIWRESKKFGLTGPVLPLDEYNIKDLIKEELVIFVCSTTGQGEEPDNMKQFWRFLLRKDLPQSSLNELNFAVLGLGDSSYAKFNYTAKKLHKRLLQLSAKPLTAIGLCDDQHDFGPSAVYLPWLNKLWDTLKNKFNLSELQNQPSNTWFKWKASAINEDSSADVNSLQWHTSEEPAFIILEENERVTSDDHFQDTRLISFSHDTLTWRPGDVLAVCPWNSDEDVDLLFSLFHEKDLPFGRSTVVKLSQLDEEMPLPRYYREPLSLEQAAKFIWDLKSVPNQRAFELLALNCADEMEKDKLIELSTSEGLDAMISYAVRPKRTIVEVFNDFPHATSGLELNILFEIFRTIKPRQFSIASVPQSGLLQILVAIVEYKTIISEPRQGICTNWLKGLKKGQRIFGCIQKGTFAIPQNLAVPLIMVGPGTGVAPFRSILLEREIFKQRGKNFLFFGCRGKLKDFYFRKDFERLEEKDVAKCFFAFSRDQEEKIYVQHLLKEQKESIRKAIVEEGGVILIAGNSKNMPTQVREAFAFILGSEEFIKEMIKTRRYQEETWS